MTCFRFNYLYRDAGNYKFRNSVIIMSRLTRNDIEPFLISGDYFVPSAVGLESIVPFERNEDDHELHEIESIVPDDSLTSDLSASKLVARFRKASKRGWFVD